MISKFHTWIREHLHISCYFAKLGTPIGNTKISHSNGKNRISARRTWDHQGEVSRRKRTWMTLRPPTLSNSCIISLSPAASCQLCITPIHAAFTALSQILTQATLQVIHTAHKPQRARGHLRLQKAFRLLRSCRRLTYLGGVICKMQVTPWITQTSRDSCSHPSLILAASRMSSLATVPVLQPFK
jgi:hypothetical protein